MSETFDFVVVGGGLGWSGHRVSPVRGSDLSGGAARGGSSAAPRGTDPGGVPGAAEEPRDRLDVHRRRRQVRARPGGRPDDDAARQDARRVVRDELHGVRAGPSRRLRRLGRGGRHRVELPRRAAVLQEERGACAERRHRDRRASAQRDRPARGLGARAHPRRARASSSKRPWRPASLAATTTAAIAAARTASCRCSRHPRGPASDRARITRSSRATSSGGRT